MIDGVREDLQNRTICSIDSTNLPRRANQQIPVQPLLKKYFISGLTQIRCISLAVSFRQEGRSRVVTSAGRDAVDARASGAPWQSQGEMNLVSDFAACETIDALADGKAVWF
jgi:hypothetical protein